ncbi:MAG TPA: Rieske 2Fe-2S domain-containing protein [Chloroflexota bacterium]|nr:Rieske 2Fe-2S domain-containing protein [Chloroflexota bacterium]
MLSAEDNELLTRTGPGTPMGALMREYWIPALMSAELPNPAGPPVRVRLLGEDLIAFRDSTGRVGLVGNHCPHRGASLFFGRNEEGGLRCVYHGWKFDTAGRCVDMPNEPPENNFKDKIRHTAYPCVERGGAIWTYMGPRNAPPPLPDLAATKLPNQRRLLWAALRSCNWAQGLEGEVDTSHFGFLHAIIDPSHRPTPGTFEYYMVRDRSPRYAVAETEYGAVYGAYREAEPGAHYWRIAQFLLPFFTMVPTGVLGEQTIVRAWVPLDDEHTMFWHFSEITDPAEAKAREGRPAEFLVGRGEVLPNTSDWLGRWRLAANRENDYRIDRAAQRTRSYTGIPGIHVQDQAITESMGPIYDRREEHLGTSDTMVIKVRQRLLSAVKAHRDRGELPPTVDNPRLYDVRSGGVILKQGEDWLAVTERARAGGDPGTSVAVD